MGNDKGHGKVLFWILAGGTLVAAFLVFWPFVSALLWASVLSILMWPFYVRLQKRFSKNFSAFMATCVTGIVIVMPFAGLGTIVGIQVYDFANKLIASKTPGQSAVTVEQIAAKTDEVLKPILSQVGLGTVNVREYIETHRDDLVGTVRGPLAKLVANLGATIITLVMALLTMFFMLRDGPQVLDPVCEIVPLPRQETEKILAKMQGTVQSVFISVVMVSLIQAIIGGISYWTLGVPAPLLWAFVTFVFCTIPLLGAPVVYVPLALQLMASGKIGRGIILLAIGFFGISIIDNVLRPFFIGSRSDLHPMVVFFALLGGVLLFGPIGIMAGPMVVTLLLGIVEVLRAKNKLELEGQALEAASA